MREWDGPVAVAVYIEYQAGTEQAGSCEGKVMQYMKEAVAELWPSSDAAPPVSVSFLYTAFDIPDAACAVTLSEKSTPASTGVSEEARTDESHVSGDATYQPRNRDYGSLSIPHRLYNKFQRTLLDNGLEGGATWKVPDSVPQGGHHPTAVKPVWHFRGRGGTKMQTSSRPWKQVYDEFYPVNALRNLAWQQVCTAATITESAVVQWSCAQRHPVCCKVLVRFSMRSFSVQFMRHITGAVSKAILRP